MADAEVALSKMIRQLRTIGRDARRMTALEAAPLVEREVKVTAAAGTTPYGDAWEPTKKGERAMPKAASSVVVTPLRESIELRVRGGYAIENSLQEGRRRQIIPNREVGLPEPIKNAIAEAAARVWRRVMGAT